MFYAGSGVLGLATLPLPAPGSDIQATAAVYATAVAVGVAVWLAPWERWPRAASLAIVPPAFALIALRNVFGGQNMHSYGVFFVVAFVWIGMAHPPRTPAAMAPLATAAYIMPLFVMPGSLPAALSSAALTIPVCLLVGEGLAWGMSRLERIELALRRERDRTEQLRELDEMKDRFLSTVSHELRTPITICRGHLEVLDEGADDRELRTVRDLLVDELDLMGRVVEDLTTLAEMDDRALLRFETLPLDGFMSSVTAKARAILPGGRVRMKPGYPRRHAAGGPAAADPGPGEPAAERGGSCRGTGTGAARRPGLAVGLAFRGGRRGRRAAARRRAGGLRAVQHRVITGGQDRPGALDRAGRGPGARRGVRRR